MISRYYPEECDTKEKCKFCFMESKSSSLIDQMNRWKCKLGYGSPVLIETSTNNKLRVFLCMGIGTEEKESSTEEKKIEKFVNELSALSEKYQIIIDSGMSGGSIGLFDSELSELGDLGYDENTKKYFLYSEEGEK